MKIRSLIAFFCFAAFIFSAGCGGSSGSRSDITQGSAMGAMNVRLVDSPTSDFKEIDLDIQQVQIHQSAAMDESGWITLGNPNKVVNLLDLQGGVVETLTAGAGLSAGTYQQLRLVLGSRNRVVLNDGTSADLTIPSGMQTGVKIPGNFNVAPGTTTDVFIDFDAANSIHIHEAGLSQSYILRPVVHGFDKAVTGSISGTLTTASGATLAAVDVFAEQVDPNGNASIVRSVKTSTNGSYTLDLLPLGGSYFVVSLPISGGKAYVAQASPELALSSSQPTQQYNAAFTQAVFTGSLSGTISPSASIDQTDTLLVLQSFPSTDGAHRLLAVASIGVVGSTPESYSKADLPIGTYSAVVLRSTLNGDGTASVVRSSVGVAVEVTAGIGAALNIHF